MQRRSCNLCKQFRGFGAHAVAGKCPHHSEMNMMDYIKNAEQCEDYSTNFVSCCTFCANESCERKSDFMSGCSRQISKI